MLGKSCIYSPKSELSISSPRSALYRDDGKDGKAVRAPQEAITGTEYDDRTETCEGGGDFKRGGGREEEMGVSEEGSKYLF